MSAVPWASWPTPFKKEYITVWDFDSNGVVGLPDLLILVTLSISIITFFVLARKHILSPIGKWFQRQFAEAVTITLKEDLDFLRHELTINGGGSVKDLTIAIQQQLVDHINRTNKVLDLFEELPFND